MALKALMAKKKRDDAQKQLDELRAKADAFATREAELEQAIAEAQTDEEKQTVEDEINSFDAEKAENENEIKRLSDLVEQFDKELAETEDKANTPAPDNGEQRGKEIPTMKNMSYTTTRAKELFGNMSIEQRTAMFEREDVKAFMDEVRSCISEKREISNLGLTIPDVYLGMIREKITNYSKLYKHVYVRPIKGEGRMNIMGPLPEAVWTEMCATLNELDLSFYRVEVDGYKVGGFISVCNASLEDSELDLAAEIITAIGNAIGKALDKAILYGKGGSYKMPLGIVTRLAQSTPPVNQSKTVRPWIDLHETNIKTISASLSGINLYKEFILDAGNIKNDYSNTEKVWVMNEKTFNRLKVDMLSINAAGAVVSGIQNTLPIVGGTVELLNFVPDNVIIGGHFDLYFLPERSGTKLNSSDQVKFLEEETVFKGSARYDGLPIIPEAFVAIGIEGVTPTADMIFMPDEANKTVVTPATVSVLEQSDSVYGVSVSTVQDSDVMISGSTFYGTLKYVSSGEPATTWGAGYFVAVDFGGVDFDKVDVEVGLTPTAGTGFVKVTTGDTKSIFKVTNKDAQVLKVITTKDGVRTSETYSLAGLKFQPTGA